MEDFVFPTGFILRNRTRVLVYQRDARLITTSLTRIIVSWTIMRIRNANHHVLTLKYFEYLRFIRDARA